MKRKNFLKNLIAIGAAVVLSMSIVACSGGQTTAEEETTTTKKIVVKKETTTIAKETITEEGTTVYQYKGKKVKFVSEIPNLIQRLNGLTIKNGETIYVNDFVLPDETEYDDWDRGSFTSSLYSAMGMDTTELKMNFDGGNDTIIIEDSVNFSVTNNSGKDITFEYAEDGGYIAYFDVY